MLPSENTTYIPLKQASAKYGLSEKVLLDKIRSGTIVAIELKKGEVLVADKQVDPSLSLKREHFSHLKGQKISISQGSREYDISTKTISRWVAAGYIKELERGYRVYIDQSDMAYCAAVYKAKYDFYDGQLSGVPIFDEDGDPYQAKYPEVAAYRRAVRERQRQRNLKR